MLALLALPSGQSGNTGGHQTAVYQGSITLEGGVMSPQHVESTELTWKLEGSIYHYEEITEQKKMVQFIQSIKSLRQHRNLNTYICSYYKDQCEYFLKASSVFIRAPKSWDYLYLEMIKMIPEILPCDVFLNKKILNLISIWHITLVSASASMVHCMFQPTFQIRYCNFRLAFCARGTCKWPMNIFPSSTKALYWVTIFAPAYWPARLSHSTLLVYILYILEFIRSQIHIHRSSYVRLTQAYPLQPVSKYGWVARNCSQVLTMSSWLTSLPNDIFPISDGTSGYEGCLCWCWGRKSHVFYSF